MPGERSSTEWQPGKRLWAQLPKLNEQPGILDVSLLVGYVWADEPRANACAVVTGTAPAEQEKIAISFAQQYWDSRKEFRFGAQTGTISECIERALRAVTHPVILADSGDNPTGGGTSDRAEVLEALLRYKVQNTVFAGITDRPATESCYSAGVGATLPLSIGATLDPLGSKPVKVHVKVVFLLPAPNPRQREAVVQIDGVTLVLTSVRRPYHDIVDFTRLGLQPTSYKLMWSSLAIFLPNLRLWLIAASWRYPTVQSIRTSFISLRTSIVRLLIRLLQILNSHREQSVQHALEHDTQLGPECVCA